MATRTASVSGLWSDTATWGGAAVPVNGDAVVINTGVTVTYDVDQSGFANGLLSLQIDGKLTFKPDTNTCLKMNGNITGTGELWVGTEENPIERPLVGSEYRCYILFNSTGTINIPTIRMCGWYPDREYTQLSADASSGQNQIVLQEDLGLQAGDIIAIGSGTEAIISTETARGIYTVSSYDYETKTITLTSNLQLDRLSGDYVGVVNKPICIKRTSGTASLINGKIENKIRLSGVQVRCRFDTQSPTGVHTTYLNSYLINHCSFGDVYWLRLGNNVRVNDSIFHMREGSGNYIGMVSKDIEFNNCLVFNSYCSIGNSKLIVKNSAFQNSWTPGNTCNIYFIDCTIKKGCVGYGGTFINCQFEGDMIDYRNAGECTYINCTFTATNQLFTEASSKLNNCYFENNIITSCGEHTESFDHNQQPGNYKAWMRGGKIETDLDGTTPLPGRLILSCESADYPVFRDFPVLLPAYRTSTWQALTKKSFTGGSVKIELIDPANDPLVDPTAAPLASYTLPDQADTNLPLKLGYKSDKSMLAILRVTAQNSTGTVEIDTRLIENRIQHGQ